jgi:D-amino peptidase
MRSAAISFALALAAMSLLSCGMSPHPFKEPASAFAPSPRLPVIFQPFARRTAAPRILIYYDMEGLAGLGDWHQWEARYPTQFATGQKLLAGEVNAVVEGLFAGGAAAVDVFDQHGSGRPDTEPDLPRELLDHRANQVIMSEVISEQAELEHNYDAVITVGGHGKARGGGFAAHTVSSGAEVIANGMPLTEVSLIAYQWGGVGVPLIMAAGVDRLKDDLRDFPWIQYVIDKRTKSASEADLIPLETVYGELREAARRAVGDLVHARVVTLSEPVTITVRSIPPGDLRRLKGIPGMNYQDNGVTFTVPKFNPDGALALIVLTSLAQQGGREQILHEVLHNRTDGEEILRRAADLYVERWLDYESGRWKPAPNRE